jgi:tryptophan synthase beta chain
MPDKAGRFGDNGGRYVPETLMPLVHELEVAYGAAKVDPEFQRELADYLTHYVGRYASGEDRGDGGSAALIRRRG